jgi:hypothetical protein
LEVDPRAETTVAFAEVLLSQRRGGAPVSKQAPRPSGAELVSVGGSLGIWVPGEHVREVGDRSFRSDSALVWVRRGIEYRLEGDLPLERMLGIARSLRAA